MYLNINGFIFKGAYYSGLALTASIPFFPGRIINWHLYGCCAKQGFLTCKYM